MVDESHLKDGRVYPPLPEIREISVQIAVAVMDHCYRVGFEVFVCFLHLFLSLRLCQPTIKLEHTVDISSIGARETE